MSNGKHEFYYSRLWHTICKHCMTSKESEDSYPICLGFATPTKQEYDRHLSMRKGPDLHARLNYPAR